MADASTPKSGSALILEGLGRLDAKREGEFSRRNAAFASSKRDAFPDGDVDIRNRAFARR